MKFSFDSVAHLYKHVYYNMPQSLKTFLGTLYGSIPIEKRYGTLYSHYLEVYKQFEEGDKQFQEDYLYNKTLETILFAEQNIQFYQQSFAKHGVSASDFKSLDDLQKFPTMAKEDIKKHIEEMYTQSREKAVAYFSGGSSSSPTKFYHPIYTSRAKHKAYSVFTLEKGGYNLRDRSILLKGREVVDVEKDVYWDYEPVDNFLNVTSSYVSSEKFPFIYKQALKFKPKFLFGYLSVILNFVSSSKAYNLDPLAIKGIILTSETVHAQDIEILKAFFGDISIFIDYGHTERVVGAYKLDFGDYHFMNAYGIPRVVNQEIIGTSLDNFVMPFINYKTSDEVDGDISYFDNSDIAKSVHNIKGRSQDYLVADDYRLISTSTLYVGHNLSTEVVSNIQYQQSEPGKVKVLVEKNRCDIDKNEILAGLNKLVKKGISFDVEIVDFIATSNRGKKIVCKQNLDIESIKHKIVKSDLALN